MFSSKTYRTLASILVMSGLISEDIWDGVLEEQRRTGRRIPEILVTDGYISDVEMAKAFSELLNIKYMSLLHVQPDVNALQLVPEHVATRLKLIPISLPDSNSLLLAMADPMDSFAIDEIKVLAQKDVIVVVAPLHQVIGLIKVCYEEKPRLQNSVTDFYTNNNSSEMSDNQVYTDDADFNVKLLDHSKIVQLVNNILTQAMDEDASDVHIEPTEMDVKVRIRIDGHLFPLTEVPKTLQSSLIARLKILSKMDIAEKRRPQDGRIMFRHNGAKVDLRVSSMPTIFGEKIVLRILDQSQGKADLRALGFQPDVMKQLLKLANIANGIFLVTGPTGSGKTTTLYALLEEINISDVNIITLEDPVEYTIDGINQVQINEKIGFTFGNALRSILRQDPDKLMLGEIRDGETAQLAIRIALTGHLILSTLHTNDAPSAINRLVDMNVPPFLIASTLKGVMAQRLLRRLCPHCKEQYIVTETIAKDTGLPVGASIFSNKGCERCRYTGYLGRVLISEVIVIDEVMESMIIRGATTPELKKYLAEQGVDTLYDSGVKQVLAGETSIHELLGLNISI